MMTLMDLIKTQVEPIALSKDLVIGEHKFEKGKKVDVLKVSPKFYKVLLNIGWFKVDRSYFDQ